MSLAVRLSRAQRFTAFVVSSAASAACFATPVLTVVPLAPGTFSNSDGYLSSDGSTVVGTTSGGAPGSQGFVWTSAGGTAVIPNPAGFTGGGARGVNGDGSVVFGSVGNSAGSYTYLWTAAGGSTLLPAIAGYNSTSARAINGDGTVLVGDVRQGGGPNVAARWVNGVGQTLGVLPGDARSMATGVSMTGAVAAGNSFPGDFSDMHPFVWTQASGMQALGSIAGASSILIDGVSGDGNVIFGNSTAPGGGAGAVRWVNGSSGWVGEILGHLPSRPAGFVTMHAANADGSILVGNGNGEDGSISALMWSAQYGIVDLNIVLPQIGVSLGGLHLTSVLGISADGTTISGYSTTPSGSTVWVITGLPGAVPSPSAAGVIALGAAAGLRRKRR